MHLRVNNKNIIATGVIASNKYIYDEFNFFFISNALIQK